LPLDVSAVACQHYGTSWEVAMKVIVNIAGVGLMLLVSFSAMAKADNAPLSLTMTNRTGSVITGITAVEKTAPDTVFMFNFAGTLAVSEIDTATVDLPDGVCVIDVTYSLASGEKILQQNVDLCNIDGVIVE
jgi:hypothetical protein